MDNKLICRSLPFLGAVTKSKPPGHARAQHQQTIVRQRRGGGGRYIRRSAQRFIIRTGLHDVKTAGTIVNRTTPG